ncbi:MAG: hypothetical protein ACN6OS_00675 [Comamonas testosteroni]|uniref:hypothetical protein n=1 Tax=Comamonas testosteroni TaxID=285 RepID=UPI003D0C3592
MAEQSTAGGEAVIRIGRNPWKPVLIISACVGFVMGGLLMWMAWEHNPQCEIHCAEQGIDWGYWLALGAGGWLLGFLGGMLTAWVLLLLCRKS